MSEVEHAVVLFAYGFRITLSQKAQKTSPTTLWVYLEVLPAREGVEGLRHGLSTTLAMETSDNHFLLACLREYGVYRGWER